jgi:hypothetical protein
METSIGQRLKSIMKAKDLNSNRLSIMIKAPSNSILTRLVKDPTKGMSLDYIQRIYTAIPDINLEYFIMGRGEMFLNSVPKVEDVSKDEKIKTLQTSIQSLKRTLQDKEKIIELLEEKLKYQRR